MPRRSDAGAPGVPPVTRWLDLLAALLLGLAAGAAWQPLGWWPLALVAIGGLGWLLWQREPGASLPRALALGWIFGLGQGLVALSWVHVIGWYVVPPLLAVMALWQGLVAMCLAAVGRLTGRGWLRCLLAAPAWSLAEYGAGRVPFGGFGWLRLGHTQIDGPLAGLLPLLGTGGLGLVVALLGHQLASAVDCLARRRWRGLRLPVALWLAALLAAPLAGRALAAAPPEGQTVNIGMVQGNVDGSAGPNAMGYARSVTDNHVSQSVTLMARSRAGLDPAPDFVLWPENSTDIDPTRDPETAELLHRASRITGLPILVGAVMDGPGPDQRQTSSLWWTTEGTVTARYDKRNLVPFGEWIPLREHLLPLVPVLAEVGAQSVPGNTPGVLRVRLPDGRPLVVGDVICFELAWDSTVNDTVTHGAQVLVAQSNTGTYTGTGQPAQQFAITRARAMELQREVVVATTNSLSGLVHPDGRVSGLTTEGTAAARTFTVPLREGTTPAVRLGPAIERLAALAAGMLLLAAVLRGARDRAHRRDARTSR